MKLIHKHNERTCADGALSFKLMALMTVCFGLLAMTLQAAPSWWTSRGAVNSNPKDDTAVVTQGQLKQFTARAVDELNAHLTNGAGTPLNNLAQGWHQDYATNNWSATNPKPSDSTAMTLTQLKYVAKLVYGQLSSAGYTGLHPSWITVNPATDNNLATLGQLKTVFNFDLSVAPAPVTNLTATANGSNEIDLSWTPPAMNNATSITVQQSTDGGATWSNVATLGPSATSYAAHNLDSTQSYTYRISNTNSSGSSSSGSSSATQPKPPVPTSPTGLTGTFDSSGNRNLSWTASTGATSYLVERETLATGVWSTLGTATSATYQDTTYGSGGYHYRVSATNTSGTSAPSTEYPQSIFAVIDLGVLTNNTGGGLMLINKQGQVAGSFADSAVGHIWYWAMPGLTHQELWADSSGSTCHMVGFNDNGVLLANEVTSSSNGAVWNMMESVNGESLNQMGTTVNLLTALPGQWTGTSPWASELGLSNAYSNNFGEALNNSNQIVGTQGVGGAYYTSVIDEIIGSLWTSGTGSALGTVQINFSYEGDGFPIGKGSPGTFTNPWAINDAGTILGSYQKYVADTGTDEAHSVFASDLSTDFILGDDYAIWAPDETGSFVQTSGTPTYYPNVQFAALNQNGYIYGLAADGVTQTIWKPDMTVLPTQNLPQFILGLDLPLYNAGGYPDIDNSYRASINNQLQVLAGGSFWQNNQSNYLVDLVSQNVTSSTDPNPPLPNPFINIVGTSMNDGGAIAGTAQKMVVDSNGNPIFDDNGNIQYETHGVVLVQVDFVQETTKGSGIYAPLNTLPVFQPTCGVVTSSYSTSYGSYQLQLSQDITTTAVATMTVNFSTASGASFEGNLTETAANSGVFHDSTGNVTLTLPVGTTTSSATVDTLAATVTCSSLGLSNTAIAFQESGANTLNFTQPQLDITVSFPGNGLSSTAADTITLEYSTDIVHDVVLTETGVNTKVFSSADGVTSLSIAGTPSFNPAVADTMQVQLTTNLLPVPSTYQLTESDVNSNVFSNFSITYDNFIPGNPADDDDGVIYVRMKGITLPAGQTIPLAIKVGVNDPDVTMSTPSGATGYAVSSKLLPVAPGTTSTYAGITNVVMDTLKSKLWLSFFGQTEPSFSSSVPRLPALLATGTITTAQIAQTRAQAADPSFSCANHLQTLDKLIGTPTGSTPPLLHYSKGKVITDMNLPALKKELPNYSIFYILTHCQGDHPSVGSATFGGFTVWSDDKANTSYTVLASDINDALNPGGVRNNSYNLVFINGCASTNGDGGTPLVYKNAFDTQVYVGWELPVTLYSGAKAAETFFRALGVKDPDTGDYMTASVAARSGGVGSGRIMGDESWELSFGAQPSTLPSQEMKVPWDSGIILNNNSP